MTLGTVIIYIFEALDSNRSMGTEIYRLVSGTCTVCIKTRFCILVFVC